MAVTRDPNASKKPGAAGANPVSVSQPVAKEVSVLASGARPAPASGKRELFTEATSTVLISKNGAVIRLAAAVIPGQLLFLVNQESKREVVTQVLRKRYFRPTNCYVELQFTESVPDFWGAQLSDSISRQANAEQCDVVKRVRSAAPTDDDLGKAAPIPSVREVKILREEVEQLRVQLKPLSQGTPNLPTSRPSPSSAVADDSKNYLSAPADSVEEETIDGVNASRLPIDSPEELSRIVETLSEPFSSGRKRSGKQPSPNLQMTSGSKSFARIIPFAAGFLLLATGIAWYARLLPGLPAPKLLAASLPDPAHHPNPVSPATAVSSDSSKTNLLANKPTSTQAPPSSTPYARTAKSFVPPEPPPVERATPAPSAPAKKDISVVSVAKRSSRSSVEKTSSTFASSNEEGIVPPKLLSSAQGIAPPEAVLGFVAGNVVVDAVVGPAGRVTSSTVVSGRPSLRPSALETIKQYRYRPATQNGRPVAAHVTITVKCWFEP